MSSDLTLGYWNVRSFAQPIRYLLHYAGVAFNDVRYSHGKESVGKIWADDKYNLGLDFPNVPYLIDGDLRLTQTVAILRYLGRKYGLTAKAEPYLSQQDMVEQQIQDLKTNIVFGLFFDNDYEKKRPEFIEKTIPTHLELLSKFLGAKNWFVGELTYVDFLAYEILDWIRLFNADNVNAFPNLAQYLKRFESLPTIAKYLASSQFKSWPIFGPIAKWGYSK